MPTKNNSPNLDQYIPEGRKRYVSYYEGAQMYGLAYTGFVKACKEAGANKKIRKTVMVDLDRFEEYLEEQYKEHGTERVRKDGKSKKKDGPSKKWLRQLLQAQRNISDTMKQLNCTRLV